MSAPSLLAERFTLRAPRDSDAEFYAQVSADTEIQRWCPGVPTGGYNPESARLYFRDLALRAERGEYFAWLIDASGLLAGQVVLRIISDGLGEMGVWGAPEARGSGLIFEALQVVLGFAFDPLALGLDRVGWTALAGNTASLRLAEKLGFEGFELIPHGSSGRALPDGTIPKIDHYIASLSREKWALEGF